MHKLATLTLAAVLAMSGAAMAQTTWYVDGNCPGPNYVGTLADPFCLIQDGINAAADGDTVLVFAWTYNETVDFIGKGITLRSVDGPDATTIDGAGLNDSLVKCVSGEGADPNSPHTIFEGFQVTNGTGNPSGFGTDLAGGGLIIRGSAPTIVNCVFLQNTAVYGGGVFNEASSPTFRNCRFEGNEATAQGGGMHNYQSDTRVINCEFVANVAFGAGIDGGGAMQNKAASPMVTNCLFMDNSASSGGGMRNGGTSGDIPSNPIITNCTFLRNTATLDGGGLWTYRPGSGNNPFLTNCVFWDNTDRTGDGEESQLYVVNGTLVVQYSCIQGCTSFCDEPDSHNVGGDPFLTTNGRLTQDSPCIDAGDTSALPDRLWVDLAGAGRVLDDACTDDTGVPAVSARATVDMGAYEFDLRADVDRDNDVDLSDLAELLARYGQYCQ